MINLLVVLITAIVVQAIGAFWYSESLFGNAWMKYMEIPDQKLMQVKKDYSGGVIGSFMMTLVMAYMLGTFFEIIGTATVLNGIFVGLMIWLGFMTPMLMGDMFWEGKSQKVVIINAAYWLIAIMVMSVMMSLWGVSF